MLRAHRFHSIEDVLARHPFMEVKALAQLLNVSDATVRRDLEHLHKAGRIQRTRGGAMQSEPVVGPAAAAGKAGRNGSHFPNGIAEIDAPGVAPFGYRENVRSAEKAAIGALAATLIEDGQSVLLAGGTTCFAAARHLRQRRVSVVTNSLPVASLLGETLGVDVLVTGGMVYPKHDILIGPQLSQTLSQIHSADWLLLGAGGANPEGFYDSNHWEVEAQRELMARAQKVALLMDAGKFGRRDIELVCGWDRIDVLVTDAEPPAEIAAALDAAGVCTMVASKKGQD